MKHKGTQDDVRSLAEMADIQEILSFFDEGGAALNALSLGGVVASDYATKTYVSESIADLVGTAPDSLNTIQELAEALKNNKDIVDTLDAAITAKANQTDLDDAVARIVELENNPSLGYDSIIDALGYTPLDEDDFTKASLGLGNVENTALSTWNGSTNINTLGTITSGTWSASTIGVSKGGTGRTSLTSGYALVGNGTSAVSLRAITSSVTSGSTSLITSGGVYSALSSYMRKDGGTFTYHTYVANDIQFGFKNKATTDGETASYRQMFVDSGNSFVIGYGTNASYSMTRICGSPIVFYSGVNTTSDLIALRIISSGINLPSGKKIILGSESDSSSQVVLEYDSTNKALKVTGNLIATDTVASGGKGADGAVAGSLTGDILPASNYAYNIGAVNQYYKYIMGNLFYAGVSSNNLNLVCGTSKDIRFGYSANPANGSTYFGTWGITNGLVINTNVSIDSGKTLTIGDVTLSASGGKLYVNGTAIN